jgi:hypothetical protein
LSSDYRLTGGKQAIPDDASAKELTLRSEALYLHICFTGLASGGGRKTIDWIAKILSENAKSPNIDSVANRIRTKATLAIRGVKPEDRMLTVLLACAEPPKKLRLVLISNTDSFDGPRRATPGDKFEVSSHVVKRSFVRSFGCDKAIRRSDRRLLVRMLRRDALAKQIRDQITSLNEQAAKNPKSENLISETCRVTSIFRDGATASEDLKLTPGIPTAFFGGLNISDFVATHFEAVSGKRIGLRQSAGAVWRQPPGKLSPYKRPAGSKVGRNDPCPCGSNKKYKRCHGTST